MTGAGRRSVVEVNPGKAFVGLLVFLAVAALTVAAFAAAIPTASGATGHADADRDGRGKPTSAAHVREQRFALAQEKFVPQFRERFPNRPRADRQDRRVAMMAVNICGGLDRQGDRPTAERQGRDVGDRQRPVRHEVTDLAVATVCPEHADRLTR